MAISTKFSATWNSSVQPRKQRKYVYKAPLHVKQSLLHSSLSPALRKKHGKRRVQVRSGDKVKVMRGSYAKKEAVVERVSVVRQKVYLQGVEYFKREGAKVAVPFVASNLQIIELTLKDQKRKLKLGAGAKAAPAKEAKKVEETKSEPVKETKTEKKEE
ncbi:TPA: 50S ribosomal protein L24 [Candidatus Woesearchaeota archaeon]|nr:50S ribosomal protein L24 [Candidatus Woesearchaeota archaeon]|tara:strand:+ start:423 stop:899 length:477 start_codon:yes stop_codon:yes gene_type:complete